MEIGVYQQCVVGDLVDRKRGYRFRMVHRRSILCWTCVIAARIEAGLIATGGCGSRDQALDWRI